MEGTSATAVWGTAGAWARATDAGAAPATDAAVPINRPRRDSSSSVGLCMRVFPLFSTVRCTVETLAATSTGRSESSAPFEEQRLRIVRVGISSSERFPRPPQSRGLRSASPRKTPSLVLSHQSWSLPWLSLVLDSNEQSTTYDLGGKICCD